MTVRMRRSDSMLGACKEFGAIRTVAAEGRGGWVSLSVNRALYLQQ